MLFYYVNPQTHHLIIYNSENNETFMTPRIPPEKIRSLAFGGELTMGSYGEEEFTKRHLRTIISESLIQQMKKLSKEGKSNLEIAKILKVSHQTVYNYL